VSGATPWLIACPIGRLLFHLPMRKSQRMIKQLTKKQNQSTTATATTITVIIIIIIIINAAFVDNVPEKEEAEGGPLCICTSGNSFSKEAMSKAIIPNNKINDQYTANNRLTIFFSRLCMYKLAVLFETFAMVAKHVAKFRHFCLLLGKHNK
jgi:hypothetical protein